MKLTALANNRVEHNLQVPMATALTLPVLVDGERGFALYVTTNAFAATQPSDTRVLKVARAVADAINKGTPS